MAEGAGGGGDGEDVFDGRAVSASCRTSSFQTSFEASNYKQQFNAAKHCAVKTVQTAAHSQLRASQFYIQNSELRILMMT